MTHICVGKLTIIGSDNDLSPERRQAIIWTSAGILLFGPLGTNFSEILIEIQTFSLKKIRLKMSSAKCCSFRLGLNVLRKHKTYMIPEKNITTWVHWSDLKKINLLISDYSFIFLLGFKPFIDFILFLWHKITCFTCFHMHIFPYMLNHQFTYIDIYLLIHRPFFITPHQFIAFPDFLDVRENLLCWNNEYIYHLLVSIHCIENGWFQLKLGYSSCGQDLQ